MKTMRKILIKSVLAIFLIGVLFSGCHKKKDQLKNYMAGAPNSFIPMYVLAGETVSAVSGGVTTPSSGVTYRWTNSINKDTIEGPEGSTFHMTLPDTICTLTITQTALADEYYNSIQTITVTTILPYGSILKNPIPTDSIEDPRDGQFYHIEKIGNLEWFTKNLNFKEKGSGYGRADDIGILFGRLYTWEDATDGVAATGLGAGPQGVCPPGWSIPTNEDWEDLAQAVGGSSLNFADRWVGIGQLLISDTVTFNGDRVWPYSANTNRKNDFKWNALATGYSLNGYNNYYDIFRYAYFWSSSQQDDDNAFYRYLYYDNKDFPFGYTNKRGLGASVRCVRKL